MSKSSFRRQRLRAKRLKPVYIRKHHTGDTKAFARLGLNAWGEHIDQLELRMLSELENGSYPASDLDRTRPWWCMVLTTDPVFLSTEERSSCEMLMGLCKVGSKGINWDVVAQRAPEIFAQLAYESRYRASISFYRCDHNINLALPEPEGDCLQLDYRCCITIPAYNNPHLWKYVSLDEAAFDRRRAKRHARRDTPQIWENRYGVLTARNLWTSGFSLRRAREHRFFEWGTTVKSLALAMIEGGATRVERVPGFFTRFPSAMDQGKLALVDASSSDELRQRWDIQDASSPGTPRRRHSI